MEIRLHKGKDVVVGGLYRHFKGGIYRVYGLVRHTERKEDLVIYGIERMFWARPLDMFCENVEVGGKTMPRFELVGVKDKND